MRDAFIDELVAQAAQHPHIALVVGDLGWSVIEPFATRFPDRFLNAGVAEQNMMGVAAGMASEGYHVFAYSIANFPTFRCAEQIRNDVDYHNLAVTVVAVGGGLSYGALGYSHHAVQDYALMRTLPNMLIAAPGDPMEVRACVRALIQRGGPGYLRLGKAGEPCFHADIPELIPGRWVPLRAGGPAAWLTTGATLALAHDWLARPEHAGSALYSMPLWSMATKTMQPAQLARHNTVFTLEDHLSDAGFGSWLREAAALDEDLPTRLCVRALSPEVCGHVAAQHVLNRLGGLAP